MISQLTSEFESIIDDKVREFVVEVMSRTLECNEDYFLGNQVQYLKSVVASAKEISQVLDSDDMISDIILAASLIHDTRSYGNNLLYAFEVRLFFQDLMPLVGRDVFDSIMYAVERQQGFDCPIQEVKAKIDDAVHVWILPIAINRAKKEVGRK